MTGGCVGPKGVTRMENQMEQMTFEQGITGFRAYIGESIGTIRTTGHTHSLIRTRKMKLHSGSSNSC